MIEYMRLLFIRSSFCLYSAYEYLRVVVRFYRNTAFRRVDLALLRKYAFRNPYAISKEFLLQIGASDPYVYGETPLTVLATIARRCRITSSDRVCELGCGRGRAAFWLSTFLSCDVVGVEQIPLFVEKAKEVKKECGVTDIDFLCADIADVDYSDFSVVYLYGTCLEEEVIRKVIDKLASLPSGAKIITVSYPLTDYTDRPLFHLVDCFSLFFGWGRGEVYLQLRI